MSGLLPTGGLNRETIRQMRTPRCGFPDVISPRERIPGAPIEYTDSGTL